ncbi:MAG: hypothetical protein IMZ61_07235 [Planctomycetes bacterium]|nr:hypothetical protein [Planctomycetota bacterium]
MSPANSRNLVVDASVMCASGRTAHPVSKASREALEAILQICHHAVMTADIRREWEGRKSLFSEIWRAAMESKGKIHDLNGVDAAELSAAMMASSMDPSEFKLVEKDAHIINAALSSDKILVTLDDRLKRTMEKYGSLASIAARIKWVNPVVEGSSIFENI